MKKAITSIILAAASFLAFADIFGSPLPSTSSRKIEDFEEGYVWVHAGEDWDRWGGHHVSSGAELARKWKTSGRYSIQLSYDRCIGEDKAVWYTDYTSGAYLDISDVDFIAMDVYNPEEHPLVLGLCIQDKEWQWLQSDTWCWFPKGEHTLVYDMRNVPASKRNQIARLLLMQPNPTPDEGLFYVDNIRGYK